MTGRVPAVGELAMDTRLHRIGVVMDRSGPLVRLRPRGGGSEWNALPHHVRPVTANELPPRMVTGRGRSVRTLTVLVREVKAGDLISIGGRVMRVSSVELLHNGARLRLDVGGLLALTSATRLTVIRAEHPDTSSWRGRTTS